MEGRGKAGCTVGVNEALVHLPEEWSAPKTKEHIQYGVGRVKSRERDRCQSTQVQKTKPLDKKMFTKKGLTSSQQSILLTNCF